MKLTKEFKTEIEELFLTYYKSRDVRHFNLFYNRLYPYFYNLTILKFNRNKEEANIIINSAFTDIYTGVDSFNIKYKPWNWLQTILVRCANYHYYQIKKNRNYYSLDTCYNIEYKESKDFSDLYKAIDTLPEYYKQFALYYATGYTAKEIIDIYNIDKSLYTRNLNIVKNLLFNRLSEGTKQRIVYSMLTKDQYKIVIAKRMKSQVGRKRSEETKKHLREARLRDWQDPVYRQRRKDLIIKRKEKL